MRRWKRLRIIPTGLALAALAIPAVAQAKPVSTEQSKAQYQLSSTSSPSPLSLMRTRPWRATSSEISELREKRE